MRFLFALSLISVVVGCQEVEQPTTVLTQAQRADIEKFILSEVPTPKHKMGTVFDQKIELIGYDVSEPLSAGKPAEFTWYWKVLDDIPANWTIFVHLDAQKSPFRQNLDHVAVNDLYQTSRWKKGEIIKDVQKVTLNQKFPTGELKVFVGLYRGSKRMPITNDAKKTGDREGARAIGGTHQVKGSKKSAQKPPHHRIQRTPSASITIDGKLDDVAWKSAPSIRLFPFGNAPKLSTDIKLVVTGETLFVGATLEDKHAWGTLKNRDDETWKEEVLEMFLDTNGDGKDYLELQITPLNTVFDAHFPVRLGTGKGSRTEQIAAAKAFNLNTLKSAVTVDGTVNNDKDEDRSWTVEFSIPLSEIPGYTPTEKVARWSINFYRFDRTGDQTSAYGWSTLPRGDFHQVSKFGTLEIFDALSKPVIPADALKKLQQHQHKHPHPHPHGGGEHKH